MWVSLSLETWLWIIALVTFGISVVGLAWMCVSRTRFYKSLSWEQKIELGLVFTLISSTALIVILLSQRGQ